MNEDRNEPVMITMNRPALLGFGFVIGLIANAMQWTHWAVGATFLVLMLASIAHDRYLVSRPIENTIADDHS